MIAKGFVETKPGHWQRVTKGNPITVKTTKEHKYHAKKKIVDGVHYDSQREYEFSRLLTANKIEFLLKEVYVLQEKFKYCGESIREIKIIPDFTIIKEGNKFPIAICDPKGMIMVDFKIKIKMLKNFFRQRGAEVPVFMPTNKKEMSETIIELKKLL